jgi:hypothetical protein
MEVPVEARMWRWSAEWSSGKSVETGRKKRKCAWNSGKFDGKRKRSKFGNQVEREEKRTTASDGQAVALL